MKTKTQIKQDFKFYAKYTKSNKTWKNRVITFSLFAIYNEKTASMQVYLANQRIRNYTCFSLNHAKKLFALEIRDVKKLYQMEDL